MQVAQGNMGKMIQQAGSAGERKQFREVCVPQGWAVVCCLSLTKVVFLRRSKALQHFVVLLFSGRHPKKKYFSV